MPLFGGRRAVWCKAGRRNIAAAVEPVVAAPSPDCRIIIEAGDLKKQRAAARALREGESRRRAALLCRQRARSRPADRRRDARGRADHRAGRARAAGLADRRRPPGLAQRDPQARALCARQGHASSIDDVRRGGGGRLGAGARRAWSTRPSPAKRADDRSANSPRRAPDGSSPAAIMSLALRHVANLHKMRLRVDAGDSVDFAMKRSARRCISAARRSSAKPCGCGPRRGSRARWSSSPRPRSTRAATRALGRGDCRSARCCRSR